MTPKLFGAVTLGLGALGIGIGIRNAIGIARVPLSGFENNRFDMLWYGLVPSLVYAGLGAAAVLILLGNRWGASATAAALMALLLVSIHGGWDLVTFLAPDAEPPGGPKRDED